ncbi:MAG TPA: ribonuclease H [Burkholderiales bacterium]|nr:ribonuclease H [Burkholderiales bacterium]
MATANLTVYTDGSSYSKPRRGGAAFLFVTTNDAGEDSVEEFELQGYKSSSNNQMELYACVAALKQVLKDDWHNRARTIVIRTDSMYVVDCHKLALFEWSRAKWRNREGRPVEHAALWKDLVRLLLKCRGKVTFQWVKGHAKDPYNKGVDKLAKRSAKGLLKKPLSVVTLRKKQSPLSVQRGSVAMRGQTELIRIITDQRLKQKEFKYRYEVADTESGDYPKVDMAYSLHDLRAGHVYRVVFNSNSRYPQIELVLEEIKSGETVDDGSGGTE